jgi:hypothetical protein
VRNNDIQGSRWYSAFSSDVSSPVRWVGRVALTHGRGMSDLEIGEWPSSDVIFGDERVRERVRGRCILTGR